MTFRGYVEAEGRGLADSGPRFAEASGGSELSEAQVQSILDYSTRAFAGAPAERERFPLVLLGGGLNGTAYQHTILAEYLASHGFVVAALSPVPEREGGRLSFDKMGLGVLVGDTQFALRELARDSAVDINRLALAGWSVSGVALAALAAKDSRVDALVSLDSGLSYDYGVRLLDEYLPGGTGRRVPFLDLRGLAPSRFTVARDSKYFDSTPGEALRVDIASLNHAQCTSLAVLVSMLRDDEPELSAGYRAFAAYTKAFLYRHVRADRRAALFLARDPSGNGFPDGMVTVDRKEKTTR